MLELDPHRLSVARDRLCRRRLAAAGLRAARRRLRCFLSPRVALAGLLWMLVQAQRKRGVHPRSHRDSRRRRRPCQAVRWTAPSGEPVAAALLQGNIEQEMKFRPQRYPRDPRHLCPAGGGNEREADRASRDRAAALLRPHRSGVPRAPRGGGAAQRRRPAAGRALPHDGEDYYNSVITLGVSPRQTYHKAHLVPFGEFIPPGFGWVLRRSCASRCPTSARGVAEPAAAAASPASASRSTSATRTRSATRSRGALPRTRRCWSTCPTSPGSATRSRPAQHLQIARLRAIETGRMHLTATNTGITAAIDRDGRVLARLPQFTEARLEVAAQGYAGVTPYVRWRDWPIVARFARSSSARAVHRAARVEPLKFAAMLTFQQLIQQLNAFWDRQGCALLQPYDMEVGAGTFHTATFLRAIGPEPWNAAYVQPSRRPKDGRYGDNPNRLQHYYQYQVVLKPSPTDIQDLYLESLVELGIDPARARHPLRRGRLGIADARRVGPGLGSLARRHGSHAVHLLPGSRRPRVQAGAGRDHLRPRAPGDVPAGQGQRLRPGVDARA